MFLAAIADRKNGRYLERTIGRAFDKDSIDEPIDRCASMMWLADAFEMLRHSNCTRQTHAWVYIEAVTALALESTP